MLGKLVTAALYCVPQSDILILYAPCSKVSCLLPRVPASRLQASKSRPDASVCNSFCVQQLCNMLADVLVFFLQKESQPYAAKLVKHAGGHYPLDTGMSGPFGTGSGISADYGNSADGANSSPKAPSRPTPAPAGSIGDAPPGANSPAGIRDDAVPANRSSGDNNHMAGNVSTSTIHTLGQAAVNTPTSQEQAAAPTHPFRDYDASTQAPEDGRVPMSQSPGNTPSASPISKTPKDVPANPITYAPNSAPGLKWPQC